VDLNLENHQVQNPLFSQEIYFFFKKFRKNINEPAPRTPRKFVKLLSNKTTKQNIIKN
jgi:hypothetical protein